MAPRPSILNVFPSSSHFISTWITLFSTPLRSTVIHAMPAPLTHRRARMDYGETAESGLVKLGLTQTQRRCVFISPPPPPSPLKLRVGKANVAGMDWGDVEGEPQGEQWYRKCVCGKRLYQPNTYTNHINNCTRYKKGVNSSLEAAKARYKDRKSRPRKGKAALTSWFGDDDLGVDVGLAGPSHSIGSGSVSVINCTNRTNLIPTYNARLHPRSLRCKLKSSERP